MVLLQNAKYRPDINKHMVYLPFLLKLHNKQCIVQKHDIIHTSIAVVIMLCHESQIEIITD